MVDSLQLQHTVDESFESGMSNYQEIPARRVLSTAIEINRHLRHENLGFLSETHGFIPTQAPLLSLPSSHAIWDEIAEELPDLCRGLRVRQRLDAMPILPTDADNLPDRMLLRASAIISAFAHSYYYIDSETPKSLPVSIQQPWEDIARRLHRRSAHMSFIDMTTYNWRFIKQNCPDPMRVENLKLLVPIWGNEEERIFLGSTIEIQAQSAPLVGAIVRAQEAACNDNPEKLQQELLLMVDCLNYLTYTCLPKVVPNSQSSLYVDPVVWAKTTAPLSVPIRKGAAGPVGAATPSFQALDIFLERHSYANNIGRESNLVREWFPKHWFDFCVALKQVSVATYIRQKNIPRLTLLFQKVLNAYAGETGFLGRHRLKAYGYIETAFKSGRSATASFKGSFKDRTWENIDNQLEVARQERYRHLSWQNSYHQGQISEVKSVSERGNVMQVKLELEGNCVYYRPGDRCAILPENNDLLVQKTLKSLRANGDELIPLDETWRIAINYRPRYQDAQSLPLRALLKFGQIRPVKRHVAKLLFNLTHNPTLEHILQRHLEQEWELWDLIELLVADGFDPDLLWGYICQVVPPEYFRLYSISSVMGRRSTGFNSCRSSTQLQLTVGTLQYETQQKEPERKISRRGTASHFLNSKPQDKIAVKIIPSPRFHLPEDVNRPIVMFAGGTGISPFRSFLLERTATNNTGQNWLLFSTATHLDFYYQQELTQLVADQKLKMNIVFSREDIAATFVGNGKEGNFCFTPATRHRIGDEIQRQDNAKQLWQFLRNQKEGGLGAYIYVCGQTGFASSVMQALQSIVESFYEGSAEEKQQFALNFLESLIAEERYMQETFTPFAGTQSTSNLYDVSEIVLHNNEDEGYWFIVDDAVYDVTSFKHKHPGGFKILRAYAGMDATVAYNKVGHHADQEIQAMLASYRIGIVRNFNNAQASSLLENLYRSWISYLFLIVEIENALNNDFSIQNNVVTYNEIQKGTCVSPVKLMMYIKTHQRFLEEFLPQIFGETLLQLWEITEKVYEQNTSLLPNAIAQLQQTEFAQKALAVYEQFIIQLKNSVEHDTISEPEVIAKLHEYCVFLEHEDTRLLSELKLVVRKKVQLFEQFGDDVMILECGTQLLQIAQQISEVMQNYYQRVALLPRP